METYYHQPYLSILFEEGIISGPVPIREVRLQLDGAEYLAVQMRERTEYVVVPGKIERWKARESTQGPVMETDISPVSDAETRSALTALVRDAGLEGKINFW